MVFDKSELEKIKMRWKKEADEYLIKAATIDLNEYPAEVQQIIKNEVSSRGLEGIEYRPSTIDKIREETEDIVNKNVYSIAGTICLFIIFILIGPAIMVKLFGGKGALIVPLFICILFIILQYRKDKK